ncbi:conserved protein of unknown function [Pseudomonas marincola]|uniref:YCII-related domain-containing protein n=1 Tax=Pseudomonas marincola TaxID=437900 RepID=A0A653E4N7_9PSED|nr:DUF6616 family protein [Pseudomonas marincola]CAE6897940.1 conserved protein of unknown function [Pseudomonas marincola]
MHILAIIWQPNKNWLALSAEQQLDYLRTLDTPINSARALGMVVLGWSAVDSRVPKTPSNTFIGVFAMQTAEGIIELEKAVAQSDWYHYFDSTNISASLQGMNEAQPHKVYAKLLQLNAD